MAGILDSITQMLTPDALSKIGGALGLEPSLVQKGLELAGPLVTGGLSRQASTPSGADALVQQLPQPQAGGVGGILSDISNMIGVGGPDPAGILGGVFGSGLGAITKTLAPKLGFDLTPLLGMVAPAVMGNLGKIFHEQNMNPAGLTQMLQTAHQSALSSATPETQAALGEAFAASDAAQAIQAKFTADEWNKIRLAPMAVTMYVVTASPSGPTGMLKEVGDSMAAVDAAVQAAPATSLLTVAFEDLESAKEDPAMSPSAPRTNFLTLISEAVAALKAKQSGDAPAFTALLATVAQKTAEAAKEGGILGFGGVQVSDAEKKAIAEITAAMA